LSFTYPLYPPRPVEVTSDLHCFHRRMALQFSLQNMFDLIKSVLFRSLFSPAPLSHSFFASHHLFLHTDTS
jgi:hypothetical protein